MKPTAFSDVSVWNLLSAAEIVRPPHYFFFLGANIITAWRPSIFGICST